MLFCGLIGSGHTCGCFEIKRSTELWLTGKASNVAGRLHYYNSSTPITLELGGVLWCNAVMFHGYIHGEDGQRLGLIRSFGARDDLRYKKQGGKAVLVDNVWLIMWHTDLFPVVAAGTQHALLAAANEKGEPNFPMGTKTYWFFIHNSKIISRAYTISLHHFRSC